MNPKVVRIIGLSLRLALGGLLLFAGVSKLRDPAGFSQEIANYQLMPELAPYVAVTLPAIELLVGGALLFSPWRWRQAGAVSAALLLGVFLVAVGSAVARGLDITCGCFGTGTSPVSWWTVLRNLGLVAAAVLLLRLDRPKSTRPEATRPAEEPERR